MIGNGPFIDLIIEVLQHEIRGVADRFRHHVTGLLLVLKARQSKQVQGQLTLRSPTRVLWSDASFRFDAIVRRSHHDPKRLAAVIRL